MKPWMLIPLLALSAYGQTTERPMTASIPDYDVKRASEKIVIDGRLDEAAWKNAKQITLQFPWDEQTGEKQRTTVRLLWDNDFLYVAYECADHDIVAKHTEHDDPTYEDDCVELFINPQPEQNTYAGLEMSARAVLYDYLYKFPHNLEKSYDLKNVQLAVQRDGTLNDSSDIDKGWVLELAIPLKNFGKQVTAGSIWRANINRWDGTEPHRRLSTWSDSGRIKPNPHNPERFGRIRFVE